jgi:hypothetical protein
MIEEEALFSQAIELSKDERTAFLEEACADDLGLRSRIEELLATHDSDSTIIDRPPVNPEDLLALVAGKIDEVE